jgi:hypothetical protein
MLSQSTTSNGLWANLREVITANDIRAIHRPQLASSHSTTALSITKPPWNLSAVLKISKSKSCIGTDAEMPCPTDLNFATSLKKIKGLEALGQHPPLENTPEEVKEVLRNCLCGKHRKELDGLVGKYFVKI